MDKPSNLGQTEASLEKEVQMDLQNLYIVRAYTYNEYLDPQASLAVTLITPQEAQRLLGYMDLVHELYEKDGSVYSIILWDGATDYYELPNLWSDSDDEWDLLDSLEEIQPLDEKMAKLLELNDEYGGPNYVKTDASTVKISDEMVTFVSHLGWCAVQIETAGINRSDLEWIAKGGYR